MPSIDVKFLGCLKDDYKKFDTFIETGTYNGDTTFTVEPYFKQIYTIEISDMYYQRTKAKYKGQKINFLFGDSSIVLKGLLGGLSTDAIFFLDGHWSSQDTGRGVKDCPLMEEIEHINTLFKHKAIIIIDDYRLFGLSPKTSPTATEDWGAIRKDAILQILIGRLDQVYHLDSSYAKDDRLIIHIRELPKKRERDDDPVISQNGKNINKMES